MELTFHHGIVSYLTKNGWLDHWTSVHMAAGAFICKVAQWLGASDLCAVLWVAIIGIAWEVLEWVVEGCQNPPVQRYCRSGFHGTAWIVLPV